MKIDFHSHILPGIDDGSRNIEESIAILDAMSKDGVDIVAATPHFYCFETRIDKFIKKRQTAYESLIPYIKPEHPQIILGAEVLYDHALVNCDDLLSLCLQGTSFLMLEMPYMKLTDSIINDIQRISSDTHIKVMIAHVERYINFTSYSDITKLMNLNVIGQMNSKSLNKFFSRRICKKLISDGFVHILGTDYHRIDSNHTTIGFAEEIISSKIDNSLINYFHKNSKKVLDNCNIEDII